MKEFDYTKWDNKPREMWVWDNDENRTVDEDIKIRVNGGEWKEPLIEE